MMGIQVGIVGWGAIAERLHAPCLTGMEEFDFIAVCDTREQRLEHARREYACEGYQDFDTFASHPGLQLIVVTTPNYLHGPLAARALELGKHVVVEKPMSFLLSEVERMLQIAKEKQLVVTTHQNRRWDNDYCAVGEILNSGRIGKPIFIQSRFLAGPWNKTWAHRKEYTGSAPFMSYGPHLLDQILTLAPKGPISVVGIVKSIVREHDYFNCYLTFSDGSTAQVEMSRASRLRDVPRFRVACEKGDLVVTETPNGESWLRLKTDEGIDENQKLPAPIEFHLQSRPFYQNIAAAIRGEQPLIVTPEQGRRYVATAAAIVESSEKNRIIVVRDSDDNRMN